MLSSHSHVAKSASQVVDEMNKMERHRDFREGLFFNSWREIRDNLLSSHVAQLPIRRNSP